MMPAPLKAVASAFPPWPNHTPDDIDAATKVLASGSINYWTGQEGRSFETEFASAVGCAHAVALMNGSVALEGALKALGIGPGDEVVVTPRSFVASASSVVMVGARPVFADVDLESQNLTAASIEAVLTPRTRAVIPVHLAGWPCEMDEITKLAQSHDVRVVEDCAQAHGAEYKGQPVGSLGDCAAWSFCQDKIITSGGEGGMVTTNDRQLWSRVWSLKDHGRCYDTMYNTDHPPGFRWLVRSFGTNWRMTEMQAAIGRVQLGKLAEWVALRRRNAGILTERLSRLPALRVPVPPAHVAHAYYKYYVFVRPERLRPGWDRARILGEIMNRGYPGAEGVCREIYREKAFADAGFTPPERLPIAQELGETSLMFLVHPTLEPEHMCHTANLVEAVMAEATA